MIRSGSRGCVTIQILILLWLPLLPRDGPAELTGKKGEIQGETHVNLRSGPDLNQPPVAILKQGQEVTVERQEGTWYLVSLPDGKKGYVRGIFVRMHAEEEKPDLPKEEIAAKPQEEMKVSPPIEVKEQTAAKEKAGSITKALDWESLRLFVGGVCLFILGWILGGNYYLRRDRIKRTKLRL